MADGGNPTSAHPVAGWYDDGTGRLRWWDGARWSQTYADELTTAPEGNAEPRRGRARISTWVGAFLFLLFLPVSVAGSGVPGLLIYIGLVGLGTFLYALITGRRSWALVPSRRVAASALAGSLVLMLAGGSLGPRPAIDPTLADAAAPIRGTAAPAPEASAMPTATPAPTPAVAFTEESPEDPDEVSTTAHDPAVVVPDDSVTADTTALTLLATLPVKGKAPKTGYDRSGRFGTAWLDVDRNGCDTRNDILARDLADILRSGPCKVMSGVLDEPYRGLTIDFLRGQDTSALVQIDHVVALMNAWQTGAQQLSQAQRISFANDPMNLLAVDGAANAQKGAGDAATWLPRAAVRCEYVARQISVKATYGLWVTSAERDAMSRVLSDCSDQPAYTSSFAPEPEPVVAKPPAPAPAPAPAQPAPAPAQPAPAPAPKPAPAPAPKPAPAPQCDANYEGACVPVAADVDCAGGSGNGPAYVRGPVYIVGVDIYDLDRDGDGIACDR